MKHIRVTKGCFEAIKRLGSRVVGDGHKISSREMMRVAMRKIGDYKNLNLFRAYKGIGGYEKSTLWMYVDDEAYNYMKAISVYFEGTYNIRLKASLRAEIIIRAALEPDEVRSFSLNLHGYKAKREDYANRIKRAAGEVNKVVPDVFFVQEMRIGEKNEFLNGFVNALEDRYVSVFPNKMDMNADDEHCICMTFVKEGLSYAVGEIAEFDNEPELKLRYNRVTIEKADYLNCWVPHTSAESGNERMNAVRLMWNILEKLARETFDSDSEFYIVGDLNAYEGSLFGDRLRDLREVMVDLKLKDEREKPTGIRNVLDHAFSNVAAHKGRTTQANIYNPSILEANISDHEALVIRSYAAV